MMVALLIYAYSTGVRSARGIERHCSDDVAFRVICANQVPDHATIARFRARHEQAISEQSPPSFGRLCFERRDVTLGQVREALDALAVLVEDGSCGGDPAAPLPPGPR